MLIKDFFEIISSELINDNELSTSVSINPDHKIFKGHFPENPVVPGVVSVQMINEILSHHLKVSLMTSSARSIKFISMIDPRVNPDLMFNIKFSETERDNFKVTAQVNFEETVFLKFNGAFEVIP